MSYRSLEIWKLAKRQDREIHAMSLALPKFELYEGGSQIRRSARSVGASIVEGYGRRRYKADYIKFLIYALSSNDETIYHLEMLCETGSMTDKVLFDRLLDQAMHLGSMLNNFIKGIEDRD
ncbi:MAG: four helix bundle protein [Cyclobacteriaceae bacterium]|nr:four helix bundle protein [Cyclobacteriaceae bacterium]